MNPVNRLLVALVSIAGFFVIPLSVLSLFLQWQVESPRFYTSLVAGSDLLVLPVEKKIRKAGLDPKAFRQDLSLARRTVKKELDSLLAPQIDVKISAIQDWFSRGSRFPRLRFDLRDLRQGLVESVNAGGARHPLVAGFLAEHYRSLPGAMDADPWFGFKKLRQLVKDIRPYAPTIFLLRRYVPLVSFVFLLLFLFTTFQVRPAFYYFSSLLAASGCFFLFVFGLAFVTDAAFGEKIYPFLARTFPLSGPELPEAVLIRGWSHCVRTLCLQGLFSCLALIASGGLFYMARRSPRKKKV